MVVSETLSFGPFKFEPHTGRLTKCGYKIKLQPKAAAALSCLLERPGEVVTRAHLGGKLWPEGTYVDFDLGIKVAIKKLRDALGDDSEEPVFIQTVIGEGYRFIARVELIGQLESRLIPAQKLQINEDIKPRGVVVRGTRRPRILVGAALTVTAVLLGSFLVKTTGTNPTHFQSKDWIIIAAFQNDTGEALLTGTMEDALAWEVRDSRYVSVVPRERIEDTFKLMRHDPQATLTESLAREVAIRDGGIKGVLSGRIERVGEKYALTVRLIDPNTGNIEATIRDDGPHTQLTSLVRKVSHAVRETIGERMPIYRESGAPPMEKATTPSVSALRAFTAGMEQVNKSNWSQAAILFEEGILSDPQFASAHIYAAHSYRNVGRSDQAEPHFQAAFRLANGVTQRERLFILGSYYEHIVHDDQQALAAYEALLHLYPDDYWGNRNAANIYGRLNRIQDRVDALERLSMLRPNDGNLRLVEDLWNHYRFDRPDKAKARMFGDRLRRLRAVVEPPQYGWSILDASLNLEIAADRRANGDIKGAAGEVARVTADAMTRGDSIYKTLVATANLALGRITAARTLCDTVADVTMRHECLLRVAFASGSRDLAKRELNDLRSSGPTGPGGAGVDICVAAWAGDIDLAKAWSKLAVDREASANMNGWILLAQGRYAEATKELTSQVPSGHLPKNREHLSERYALSWNRYALSNGLDHLGKVDEAILNLEEARLPRADLKYLWLWPLYSANLAKLYRHAGRIDQAIKVENELRHLLSEADADYRDSLLLD